MSVENMAFPSSDMGQSVLEGHAQDSVCVCVCVCVCMCVVDAWRGVGVG
jgi:hypothetical protein